MSSENYEYKYYQNFVITWNQFYDAGDNTLEKPTFLGTNGSSYATRLFGIAGNIGFTPFENSPFDVENLNATNLGKLNLFFDLNLNPPKNNPKKIVVKNITSSFTESAGSSFSLICPILFKFPIQFLDSINNTMKYEEYLQGNVPFQAKVNLVRLSGSNPLQTADYSIPNPTTGTYPNIPYIANPSLNFTIVYEYW